MSSVDGTSLLANLAVSAGVIAVLMAVTSLLAFRKSLHSIVDVAWGIGFVLVATVSAALSVSQGNDERKVVTLALVATWGLRLAIYLYRRAQGRGEDQRYETLLSRRERSKTLFALTHIYLPQGLIMWLVSVPIQVCVYERSPLGVLGWVSAGVAAAGLLVEAVSDAQLQAFRSEPANAGQVLSKGLWAWSRHPNYFGDTCLWWGVWGLASSTWIGVASVFSPIVMTFMIVAKTGKSLLEKNLLVSKGESYARYVQSTSGFLPRRPRRR